MFLSVFDMFKVGVGPSSSHTMGPMVAGARFLEKMRASPFHFKGLRASLHGSLAFTGVGHATDRATILGLAGFEPATYDAARAEAVLAEIKARKVIDVPGMGEMAFDPGRDLVFDYGPALAGHANGMILKATDAQGDVIMEETYYSIGGGFVLTAQFANRVVLWQPQEPAKLLTIGKVQNPCGLWPLDDAPGVAIGGGLGLARWHATEPGHMLRWPAGMAAGNHWAVLG